MVRADRDEAGVTGNGEREREGEGGGSERE